MKDIVEFKVTFILRRLRETGPKCQVHKKSPRKCQKLENIFRTFSSEWDNISFSISYTKSAFPNTKNNLIPASAQSAGKNPSRLISLIHWFLGFSLGQSISYVLYTSYN